MKTRNVVRELEWGLREADGDMGRRAAGLEPHTPGGGDYEPHERAVEAAERYRTWSKAWNTLGYGHKMILRLVHGGDPRAHPTLGPMAMLMAELRPTQWPRLRAGTASGKLVAEARAHAHKVYDPAIRVWRKAMKAVWAAEDLERKGIQSDNRQEFQA